MHRQLDGATGRLGDGTAEFRGLPTAVLTGLRFTEITTAAIHTCAISIDRELYCWGSNRFDQLGVHPDTLSLLPIPIAPGMTFADVDAGGLRTCGIADAGDTFCWGQGLGPDLARIDGPVRFASITLGAQHACGLSAEGQAFCFGSNTEGQLGDGTTSGSWATATRPEGRTRPENRSRPWYDRQALSSASRPYRPDASPVVPRPRPAGGSAGVSAPVARPTRSRRSR